MWILTFILAFMASVMDTTACAGDLGNASHGAFLVTHLAAFPVRAIIASVRREKSRVWKAYMFTMCANPAILVVVSNILRNC